MPPPARWLYFRFTLSFRDVEDLLAERGIAVSYETVRRRVNYFGPLIAADLSKRRPRAHTTWHLDEVFLKIDGRLVYLWRAVDSEGEVLDVPVQAQRDRHAALKLMRKLLKKHGFVPDLMITDELRSYVAAARNLGIGKRHARGRWRNNRAENSHQPIRRRERKMRWTRGALLSPPLEKERRRRSARSAFDKLTIPSDVFELRLCSLISPVFRRCCAAVRVWAVYDQLHQKCKTARVELVALANRNNP